MSARTCGCTLAAKCSAISFRSELISSSMLATLSSASEHLQRDSNQNNPAQRRNLIPKLQDAVPPRAALFAGPSAARFVPQRFQETHVLKRRAARGVFTATCMRSCVPSHSSWDTTSTTTTGREAVNSSIIPEARIQNP